jgi:hypothetical protein
MSENSEDFKQLNIRAPKVLYEKFHRFFPARGEKQAFFLRILELAVEKGDKWSMVRAIQEEVEDKYGRD